MTPKVRTAKALAHALLAGSADHDSAMERCAQVLDQHPPWLTYLVRSIRQQFKHEWHAGSLSEMTASIERLPDYQRAWLSKSPPRVRRPNLSSLAMAPRPQALSDCAPPDLATVGAIADWLVLPPERLEWLTGIGFRDDGQNVEAFRHYQYRWLEKRSGGRRLLEVPKSRLRAIQRRILHELLEHIPPHEAAQGFRKGRSCLGNAELHVGQKIVLHFDLQDFFLHVRGARVAGLFRTLGYPEHVTRVLTGLCTHRAPSSVIAAASCDDPSQRDWELGKRYQAFHLPQGAPTSPYLANLCAFGLDVRLHGLARHLGGNYSRYADDLVLSGGDEMARAVERLMPLVGAIALDEGFRLNHRKTRVMRQGTRQIVTGIVVNQRPNLLRAEYDALKATLFNCARDGAQRQNLAGHQDFRAHLLGKIASVRHIHAQKGERLMEIFRRIAWEQPA
jgi:hypothetical protein